MLLKQSLLTVTAAIIVTGCMAGPADTLPAKQPADTTVKCASPRPKVCHKALRPVCATRDNGVRCVTTPCDSTDQVAYPNECLACQDPAVYFYSYGACAPAPTG